VAPEGHHCFTQVLTVPQLVQPSHSSAAVHALALGVGPLGVVVVVGPLGVVVVGPLGVVVVVGPLGVVVVVGPLGVGPLGELVAGQ
jgi:hypothetical protein